MTVHASAMCMVLLASVMSGAAPAQTRVAMETRVHTLMDRASGHRFVVQVGLPTTYARDSLRRYGVLYVLDGDKSFGLARDIVDWLAWWGWSEIPPLIVVGIGYGTTDADWLEQRSRDLTPSQDRSKMWGNWPLAGGAAAFTAWVETSLVPFVDSAYRVTPGDRAVAGVSLGGLYAVWAAVSDPVLFPRAIAVNPTFGWDSFRIRGLLRARAAESKTLPLALYLALGDKDGAAFQGPWREMVGEFAALQFAQLRLITEVLPGETHISAWPIGLTHGLKALYPEPSR